MGPVRLDDEVWTPSALGVVGPHLLRGMALGSENLYRPLLAAHRDRPGVATDDVPGTVELVTGEEAWERLGNEPGPGGVLNGPLRWLRTHPAAATVAVRHGDGGRPLAVLAVAPDAFDPRIGEVVLVWAPDLDFAGPASANQLLGRGWLRLFQGAAYRDMVGLTVAIGHRGARDVRMLRELAGFRPAADCYAEVGLSPADEGTVLDEWRVTIADDQVTDIGLLVADGDAARRELLRRLIPLFRRRGPEPEKPAEPYRRSLGGPVGFDGCYQSHDVEEGDWWEPEPPLGGEACWSRSEWALVRWAQEQLAPRAG